EAGARPGDYIMVWGKNCFFGYTVSPDGEIWWFANPPSRTEIPRNELRQLTTNELRERLVRLLEADKTPGARVVGSATPRFPPTRPVRPARGPGLAQRLDGDHRRCGARGFPRLRPGHLPGRRRRRHPGPVPARSPQRACGTASLRAAAAGPGPAGRRLGI